MNCEQALELLEPFLLNELPTGNMRGVQLHLGGCAGCRQELKEVRKHADVVIPFYFTVMAHDEVTDIEKQIIDAHLAYCEACRDESEKIRATAHELTKNLSQYQLSRVFRIRVMREWKPHRVGRRKRYNQRGLADMIERAEASNTFSYERHVDRFKDYCYVTAYRQVGDFHWASEIAREVFVRGMPVFPADLTQSDFLKWLDEATARIADRGGWLEEGDDDATSGLSGYENSRKLRRHRLILEAVRTMEPEQQIPMLLFYVQRLHYNEISSLLELSRTETISILDLATRDMMSKLRHDSRQQLVS